MAGSDGESEAARDLPDMTYEPHRLLENVEMAEQIQKALTQLPEKLRATLLLHDIEGTALRRNRAGGRLPAGNRKIAFV